MVLDPALPTEGGAAVVDAPTAADAVRRALAGTVTVSVGGRSTSYPFRATTAGLSAGDRRPYEVAVAGDTAVVWLEDLAGSPGQADWDYNDRSWRVAVRPHSPAEADPPVTASAVTYPRVVYPDPSTPAGELPFRLTNGDGQVATVDLKVSETAAGVYQWDYTVSNQSVTLLPPLIHTPLGGSFAVGVADPGVVADWGNDQGWLWHNPWAAGQVGWAAQVEGVSAPPGPGGEGMAASMAGPAATGSPTLPPGTTGKFSFRTPARPVVWQPGLLGAGVDTNHVSAASGQVKGPGAAGTAATGDLDIIDSNGAEVAEDQEETPGGWVPVNNDNDNYNFVGDQVASLTHKYDRDESAKVDGENDLVPIRVHNLVGTGGNGQFKLTGWTSRIKVWYSKDKAAGVVAPGTVFLAGSDTTLWVEGLQSSDGPRDEEILLTWTDGAGTKIVDKIRLTVYEVAGAMNVPGYAKYDYAVAVHGGEPRFATVNGISSLTSGPINYGTPNPGGGTEANSRSATILWGEGAVVGKYRVYPNAADNFYIDREVNVVKVGFGHEDNKFIPNSTKAGQDPGNPLKVMSSTQAGNPNAMTAQIRVTAIQGPLGGRGVRFIDLGFVQTAKVVSLHADYQSAQKRITCSLEDGKWYIDSGTQSTKPWYARNLAQHHLDTNPDDTSLVSLLGFYLFKMVDNPYATPTDKQSIANPGGPQNPDVVDFLSIVFSFETFVAVHTKEAVLGSETMYANRAKGHWTWNGSGTINNATLVWTPQQGVALLSGSDKFVEVQDGSYVPHEIAFGVAANDRPVTYSNPQ